MVRLLCNYSQSLKKLLCARVKEAFINMYTFLKKIPAVAAAQDPTVKSLMQRSAHPSKLGEGNSRNG